MRKLLIFIIFVCNFANFVHAEDTITLKKFLDLAKSDNSFLIQVMATGEAFGWANSDLKDKNQQLLYCTPPNFSFYAKNYLDILLEQTKKVNYYDMDYRVYPLLLLNGLKETFPCK